MRTQPEAVDWFAECRKASTYAFILKARLRQLQMENERLTAKLSHSKEVFKRLSASCDELYNALDVNRDELSRLGEENERLHAQRDALLELVVEMDRHEREEGWSEDLRVKIDAAIKAVEGEKK